MTEQPSLFPECGHFPEDVFERARALVAERGHDAPTLTAIRSTDDIFDEEERSWWVEVSRACKCILHPWFKCVTSVPQAQTPNPFARI
jgi:hypothetical protein